MGKRKLVMIGNGMAGIRTLEELLKLTPELYDITVFGNEPYPNYNRIQLSTVLQGDTTVQDIIMNDWQWYKDNNIELFTGEEIIKIDTEKKQVLSDNGRVTDYDECIFATGSRSFIIPFKGHDKEGVTGFRNIEDCEYMIESSKDYKKAVVIGGGLLGLEAARGLLNLGMEVKVVHLTPYLMEKQLDPVGSKMLQQELEAQGMEFLMEKDTEEILGDDHVAGIRFKDGTEVETDLVVMAVGVRANISVAKDSGIEVNRAIVVNDFLETSVPNIYAVGECAEHRGNVYGLVAPLYEQGKVLADFLAGKMPQPYEGSIVGTGLKVSGVDLYSAGAIMDDPSMKAIKVHNEFDGVYKKVLIRDNKIAGVVLFGDTADSTRLFGMMRKNEDVSGMTSVSILSSGCEAGAEGDVASMADDDLVCGCNGVSKGTIVNAIKENGLTTVDEVGSCTNAGRSCGRCKSTISSILSYTLGSEYDQTSQKESICGCTTLSRDEVVSEIKEKGLTTVKEVMNVLGWENEEGCSKCRPALNYYLGMIYMDQYSDDRDSRLVNEKMHANIQKDGSYTVIPRMYGGVTTAQDLKTIAEVAEKYEVPLVKLTGGQRIGLFGVKKCDLPAIWEELDMPSGYAYGKTLRTVKTCVGSEFCRYGTQNSMGLGIKLEKKFERLDTPHKVKMSASGCPRNCSESGIKDIGFVGVEDGYEVYVGGNGGTDLRAGDLLGKVRNDEEALELTGAYLQYYRETAQYLERTSKWLERVGLNHIKEVLASEETRKSLNERLDATLSRYRDPWQEALQNDEIKEKYYTVRKMEAVVK